MQNITFALLCDNQLVLDDIVHNYCSVDTDEGVNCGLLIPQLLSVLAFEVIQRISVQIVSYLRKNQIADTV